MLLFSHLDTVTEYLINSFEQCLCCMARLEYQSKWLRDFVMQCAALEGLLMAAVEWLALHSLVSIDFHQLNLYEP